MHVDRFEPPIERRGTSSEKWEKYAGRDVLPFWVADMDLPTAPFVIDAARERLRHPILGYTATPPAVVEAFLGWLRRCYGWQVREDWLVWIPGVVPGFNFAARAVVDRGEELVIPTPVYPPFLKVPRTSGLRGVLSPLLRDGQQWCMDFDALAEQISSNTAAVLFCNPQNPTGRVYDQAELERLAELVVANDTIVVSDEIHCPLILDPGRRHIPLASLDAAVAARSITLFAPTKAYNFPGLGCAVAVIPDAALRTALRRRQGGSCHQPLAARLRCRHRGVQRHIELAGRAEQLPGRQCGATARGGRRHRRRCDHACGRHLSRLARLDGARPAQPGGLLRGPWIGLVRRR